MQERKYDVIFMGGGGASYPGAFQLAESGHKILMVDPKGNLGGNCLFSGCIPSKTVRKSLMDYAVISAYNGSIKLPDMWSDVQSFKDSVQKIRYDNHYREIRDHETNVDFVKGTTSFLSDSTLEVSGEQSFTASSGNIVIGTGADPFIPDLPGSSLALTSDNIFAYKSSIGQLPGSIILIGGGYISVEIADMLAPFGIELTIIQSHDRLLPGMDKAISDEALRLMSGKHVSVIFNGKVKEISKSGKMKIVKLMDGDEEKILSAEEVVMATGRRPHIKGIGLEKTTVKTLNNSIVVDSHMRTSRQNIFATGDVIGRSMLFHAAVKESVIAARNIEGKQNYVMNFSAIPFTLFSYPELGSVGYTEADVINMGIDYEVVSQSLEGDAQSQIFRQRDGWFKIVIEKDGGRILGFQTFAHDGADLVAYFTAAIENGMTAKALAMSCEPHPTTFEAIPSSLRKYL
jgi:dihydrolipoamide dehydrogenase